MATPRRSARIPTAKRTAPSDLPQSASSSTSATKRQKVKGGAVARPKIDKTSLQYFLNNSKSKLCDVHISELVNPTSWAKLSNKKKQELVLLLPRTSFSTYKATIYSLHPSLTASSKKNPSTHNRSDNSAKPTSSKMWDLISFKIPSLKCHFFISAATAYQEHILRGYFNPRHIARVKAYETSVRNGTGHAQWKDEEWNLWRPPNDEKDKGVQGEGKIVKAKLRIRKGKGKPVATSSRAMPTLSSLVAKGTLRVGDILAYKRHFSAMDLDIEKDLLVQSIDRVTSAVTFILSSNALSWLEEDILICPLEDISEITGVSLTPALAHCSHDQSSQHPRRREPTRDSPASSRTKQKRAPQNVQDSRHLSITCGTTASALESHILPLFEFVELEQRAQSEIDSWKCFTVWRWDGDAAQRNDVEDAPKGGRTLIGTLYYLKEESGEGRVIKRIPRRK